MDIESAKDRFVGDGDCSKLEQIQKEDIILTLPHIKAES